MQSKLDASVHMCISWHGGYAQLVYYWFLIHKMDKIASTLCTYFEGIQVNTLNVPMISSYFGKTSRLLVKVISLIKFANRFCY